MPFTKGVFFDNCKIHLDSFRKVQNIFDKFSKLYLIAINETEPVPLTDPLVVAELFKLSPDNKYVHFHAFIDPTSTYDPVSGIKEKDFRLMDDYLTDGRDDRKYVVFDWDRTLTVVEGYISISNINKDFFPNIDITSDTFLQSFREDTLLYLFGGEARLTMIRDKIKSLRDRGITLCILTNNTGCATDEFKQLVRQLDPGFTDDHIICSGIFPSKRVALATSKLFNGGSRKSRRRRSRTLRKA